MVTAVTNERGVTAVKVRFRKIQQLDEPHRSIARSLADDQRPADHLVFFAHPGPHRRLHRAARITLIVSSALVLGAALVIGLVTGSVELNPYLELLIYAILFVFGVFALSLLTEILFRFRQVLRFRRMVRNPGSHAIALGPRGLVLTFPWVLSTRAAVIDWGQTEPWHITTPRALTRKIAFAPRSWLVRGLVDDYDAPIPVIFQAIDAGRRLSQEGSKVTNESIRALVAPEGQQGRPVTGDALPTVLDGPLPEPIDELAERLGRLEPVDGVRLHDWNRSWRGVFLSFLATMASLLLCLPAPVLLVVTLLLLFRRGEKARWFVAFLPEGLLVHDQHGLRSLGWNELQMTRTDGDRAVLVTSEGEVLIDGRRFALAAEEITERCHTLRRLSLRSDSAAPA